MEVIIPLVLSFILPLISAPGLARQRADLTGKTICLRFGAAAGGLLTLLMVLFAGQTSATIGGGLGAFFLLVLAIPTGFLAFLLGAGSAALGVALARRK